MSDPESVGKLDVESADRLEKSTIRRCDPRQWPRLRPGTLLRAIAFAIYHIWTAGFGTPVEHVHMGIHLTGLFILIFAGFPLVRSQRALEYRPNSALRWANIPAYDWVCAILGVMAALFLAASWNGLDLFGYEISEQALRQGDPSTPDIILGTALGRAGP